MRDKSLQDIKLKFSVLPGFSGLSYILRQLGKFLSNSEMGHMLDPHCNSEKICILRNVQRSVLFFFINLSQGIFLYCPWFFILTKLLDTGHTRTETKQKPVALIFLCQDFC